ncbi:hypothetical protein XarjCFBP7645_12015 [Xanthomonas arboricola]|uniref:Uncharacterized protein n=1 Tax=Xanthomonas arboricola TaxID=56448 RepID=A0A2S7AES7_9XANT|nr:hypothetical protein XarbCFBP8152_07055 [Xanthomonas arboricola]PPU08240.1 hypothetical protein XarjCFBP7645_12015 [Xanthomonas arboricola]
MVRAAARRSLRACAALVNALRGRRSARVQATVHGMASSARSGGRASDAARAPAADPHGEQPEDGAYVAQDAPAFDGDRLQCGRQHTLIQADMSLRAA